jgi:hypothetical protein
MTALADEESLEPTTNPSSLRGIADVRITIYVAALRTALADPRQPSAAESWLLVSTARPQLGLSSDRVRQELSPEPCPSRNAILRHAQPRSNTENSTGPPAPTPGSAFRKGLRQPKFRDRVCGGPATADQRLRRRPNERAGRREATANALGCRQTGWRDPSGIISAARDERDRPCLTAGVSLPPWKKRGTTGWDSP